MTPPSHQVLITTMDMMGKITSPWRPVEVDKLSRWTVPSDPPLQSPQQPLGSTLWAVTSRIIIITARSRSPAQPIRMEHGPTSPRRPMTIRSLQPLHRPRLSCHQWDRWCSQTAPATVLPWQPHCTHQQCLGTKVAPPSLTPTAPPLPHLPQLTTSPPPPVPAARLHPLPPHPRCLQRWMAGSHPVDQMCQ